MLIPKMEDGNNFGVAVQEEVNNTLDEVESRTYNVLEGLPKIPPAPCEVRREDIKASTYR